MFATLRSARRALCSAATTSVRRGHEVDVGRITPLLLENGTLTAAEAAATPEVQQFSHGQSNPTYLVSFGGRKLVVRKQPPGKLLRGAHAVDREARVFAALAKEGTVPVPALRLFCDDADVLGTPFLVCDFVGGRFFPDAGMGAAESPQERAALYGSFVRTIGAIHSVDVARAGLEDFGKAGGYIARQYKVPRSRRDLYRIGIALRSRPGAAGVVVAVPRGGDPSDRADGEIDGVDTRGDARRRRPHYAGPR